VSIILGGRQGFSRTDIIDATNKAKAGHRGEGISAAHFNLEDLYRTQPYPDGKLQVKTDASPQSCAHLLPKGTMKVLHTHVRVQDKRDRSKRKRSSTGGTIAERDHTCPPAQTGGREQVRYPYRCPCTLSSCLLFVKGSADAVLPPNVPAPQKKNWLNNVVHVEAERARVVKERLGVHVSHFNTTAEYTTATKRGGWTKHIGTPENKPKKAKVSVEVHTHKAHSAGRLAELKAMGLLRASRPKGYTVAEANRLAVQVLQQHTPWFEEERDEGAGEHLDPDDRTTEALYTPSITGKTIWELLQDNRECWWYTGEESFELLKLMFAYINADKAFDTITEYRKERANNSAKDKQKGGRKSALTPFEQFVFWRVVFKRFRGRGQLHHGGNLFGLPARSADRLYITWTQAMGRFFDGKGLASLCTRACVCAS
jgi:hypothetical protein